MAEAVRFELTSEAIKIRTIPNAKQNLGHAWGNF